jgi:uroporphyrinogen decarboxylase
MGQSPRELVLETLAFASPARAPRQLWWLPWAETHYAEKLKAILADYPPDIESVPGFHSETAKTQGDPYALGEYVDEWGCRFINVQTGVIGEVKEPIVRDWDSALDNIHVPREWLTMNASKIDAYCGATERFTIAGCCPRPFEQMQFLRGTVELYMDLLAPPPAMEMFMREMHTFYCQLLEKWAATNVDALMFMDDWGSQRNLLIDPAVWRAIFKPLYRDYVDIAHGAGKKIFMHSDGHIAAIYPDLIELGVDAVNSQIFCMGIETLAQFAGKITFWGEIDRQRLLPNGTPGEIDRAVREVHAVLWRQGGCIAQCEFGAGARPENVRQVFASWDMLTK